MKPGEGKPHRDLAIRCKLGAISPVLAVKNTKGEANYYLVSDRMELLSRNDYKTKKR